MPPYTTEHFFNKEIIVFQPRSGYRFSMDPVILAAHAIVRPGDRIVDLGTGCGIIPLILAHRYKETSITGIEIQKELADLARKNTRENRVTDRVSILRSDMRTLAPSDIGGYADLVITNPPYKRRDSGRINPDPQKAIARHEIELTLHKLLKSAKRILDRNGRFMIIFPTERQGELICEMEKNGIGPSTARLIHTKEGRAAKLVIITGINNQGPSLSILPPLFLEDSRGNLTEEFNAMFIP